MVECRLSGREAWSFICRINEGSDGECMDIYFAHLGIGIKNLQSGFYVFGFRIAFYGVIIAVGMLTGIWMAVSDAKRRGQSPEIYTDFALYAILFSILGARIYYVLFSWDMYKDNPMEVFNIRGGGMAIYGAVIGAALTLYFYIRKKKISFFSMADTGVLGLLCGQIIGRFGNFVNAEAFGGYTDSFLAMRIRMDLVAPQHLNEEILANLKTVNGLTYIQVHPTFLYESLWNLGLLIFLLFYRHKKRFEGELFYLYLGGYGLGRSIIEGLRTDSLIFFNTGLAVSQVLAILCVIFSVIMIFRKGKIY